MLSRGIIPQILGTGLQGRQLFLGLKTLAASGLPVLGPWAWAFKAGGDRVLALKVCGEAAHPPAGWRQGDEWRESCRPASSRRVVTVVSAPAFLTAMRYQ